MVAAGLAIRVVEAGLAISAVAAGFAISERVRLHTSDRQLIPTKGSRSSLGQIYS